MEEKSAKLRVISRDRSKRCRYDEASKRALVEACLRPGVSVARQAQENGVNANLLRKWITQYLLEREQGLSHATPTQPSLEPETDSPQPAQAKPMPSVAAEIAPAAFVPIVQALPATAVVSSVEPASPSMAPALHVHLPNGVRFDLGQANLETLSTVVQMLGRLPCSGSTKD
jgi:transposase